MNFTDLHYVNVQNRRGGVSGGPAGKETLCVFLVTTGNQQAQGNEQDQFGVKQQIGSHRTIGFAIFQKLTTVVFSFKQCSEIVGDRSIVSDEQKLRWC